MDDKNVTEKVIAGVAEADQIDWGEEKNAVVVTEPSSCCWSDTLLLKSSSGAIMHCGLPPIPVTDPLQCSLVRGEECPPYYHYGCDGQDDRGWGCGYRTVQTMASWLSQYSPPHGPGPPLALAAPSPRGGPGPGAGAGGHQCKRSPPSLPEIQQALVAMGDKPGSFSGSREWIGTFEAALVLDYFYDVPCKVVHVRGGGGGGGQGGTELERVAVAELHLHFQKHGSPVMMGGDRDNSSKGILGVCSTGRRDQGSYLLVMDPHYYGPPLDRDELHRRGWVAWKRVSSLDQCSFYNLCLPQSAKQA